MTLKKLTDWIVYPCALQIKSGERKEVSVLCGTVDGRRIPIFGVKYVHPEKGIILSDDNVVYFLGDANKEYERKHPNARLNLLNGLKENKCQKIIL